MNPFEIMKNAKQLKEQFGKMQEELEEVTVVGASGGGIVKITINGHFQVVDVFIDPIAVDPRDVQMLQDLIVAASLNANEKIKEAIKDKLGPYAGSFPRL